MKNERVRAYLEKKLNVMCWVIFFFLTERVHECGGGERGGDKGKGGGKWGEGKGPQQVPHPVKSPM